MPKKTDIDFEKIQMPRGAGWVPKALKGKEYRAFPAKAVASGFRGTFSDGG